MQNGCLKAWYFLTFYSLLTRESWERHKSNSCNFKRLITSLALHFARECISYIICELRNEDALIIKHNIRCIFIVMNKSTDSNVPLLMVELGLMYYHIQPAPGCGGLKAWFRKLSHIFWTKGSKGRLKKKKLGFHSLYTCNNVQARCRSPR